MKSILRNLLSGFIYYLLFIQIYACQAQSPSENGEILPAVNTLNDYLGHLQGKRVAVLTNQSSLAGEVHLIDTLLSEGVNLVKMVNLVKIFGPEHGFRGDAPDGAIINDSVDFKTGIPIISLYGTNKKIHSRDLDDVDIVVFDMQDVGVRFFTYISTMHLAMEACAENDTEFLVLDRPNPNGYYIDGPLLDPEFKSFVGMHPIPLVHGLTVGELAKMINGEGWLKDNVQCKLTVIKARNYNHDDRYTIPVKPSPNLPNALSINLYPTLALFEGTVVSIGRGTTFPFQVIGYPDPVFGDSLFTPVSIPNMSKYPKHENKVCYGQDFREIEGDTNFTLKYLIDFYKKSPDKETFFKDYIYKLTGNKDIVNQIKAGFSEAEIKATWQTDLEAYRELRKKYILYPDFE